MYVQSTHTHISVFREYFKRNISFCLHSVYIRRSVFSYSLEKKMDAAAFSHSWSSCNLELFNNVFSNCCLTLKLKNAHDDILANVNQRD